MSDYELVSSLPLIKKDESFEKTLTPKLSLRFSPNDMKDNSSIERKIDVNNIFANNRLGLGDSLESGRSLTIGVDYKKSGLKDINKYFDFKLATVFRDKEENFLPKVSTLNRKTSNVFGSISTNFTEFIKFDYDFAIDNDLKTLERNSIKTSFSVNRFNTTFNFLEENGEMGDINTVNNSTRYQVDDNNYLTFNTRRNRKINLTEFYDLVYEYKNDCLTAAIKYNKTYYQDRDIMPTENVFFTITLFPLTTIEQKIDK
jgi:LPS-assembly protein